jgi:hypothetical protein
MKVDQWSPFPSVPQLGFERSRSVTAIPLVASPPRPVNFAVSCQRVTSLVAPIGQVQLPRASESKSEQNDADVCNMMRMSSQNEAFWMCHSSSAPFSSAPARRPPLICAQWINSNVSVRLALRDSKRLQRGQRVRDV